MLLVPATSGDLYLFLWNAPLPGFLSSLHRAVNVDVIYVQAGEAARALRGSLGNQIAGTVYLAFFFHHLTVGPPTDKTVEAVMAFGNALVGLISAVPAASAPADSRLDRSPVWCTSGRHQSGSDMLFLPLKHQAGAADMAPGIKALQQAPDKDLACPAALPEIVSLTRVQALNLFLSGVKPPDGPCLTILQDRSRPEEQRLAALQILITFYGCNHNPIITDAHSATYACGFHFQGFADAYASEDLQFSRQHLAALQALAKHKVFNKFLAAQHLNTFMHSYVKLQLVQLVCKVPMKHHIHQLQTVCIICNMSRSLHRERLLILSETNATTTQSCKFVLLLDLYSQHMLHAGRSCQAALV